MNVVDEALRLLGCGGVADEKTRQMAEAAVAEVRGAAVLRHTVLPLSARVEEGRIITEPLCIESASLAKHLGGCTEILLFAATLGAGVDRLLYRLGRTDISAAACCNAAASALIEEYCDEACAQLSNEYCARGLSLTGRFSPGYGDFPLSYQANMLHLLDAGRKIGLCMTEGSMLAPVKSVTAVLGIGKMAAHTPKHSCAACGKRDCAYRRNEDGLS